MTYPPYIMVRMGTGRDGVMCEGLVSLCVYRQTLGKPQHLKRENLEYEFLNMFFSRWQILMTMGVLTLPNQSFCNAHKTFGAWTG